MKKILRFTVPLFIISILFLGLVSYSSKIKNPFIPLKALIQLETSDDNVIKFSDKPLRYMSRSVDDFKNHMEYDGYTVDQLGRCFVLEKDSETTSLIFEGFLGSYEIFSNELESKNTNE
ncbi:hypothetical protein [Romboutsia lituseburensis]|uniref:Uncharacterized protein n=1 Tax=Romboutsia lituseburensis DSM 797 TaxID=1121325 RepID=A0A1G9TEN6_9FIRM|nr:hypothetical protein [Romboutsia lituseburensis]CEH36224.1 Hypothetical protein RLITU_3666 [Romboutsia lituseburensis]SDM46219.1 hypothetical protein SAMN04515677_11285 [Romboutsia lituseburensis DSM 797]